MIIGEYELFEGFGNQVVEELVNATSSEQYEAGQAMFKQGDPADAFYVLTEGSVRLTVEGIEAYTYVARNIGETIGWSSVAGRDAYSATATCQEPTRASRYHKQKLDDIFRRHPQEGLLFYKRLAKAVGERLIECHRVLIGR